MTAADWLAERARIEQAATDGPWMSEWDTSDEWWTIHGQPNPTKGDERMVCPEVATLQHSEDWTADVDFITDTRTSLPKALNALEAVLKLHEPVAVYAQADECECGNEDHTIIESEQGDDLCWDTPTGEQRCGECLDEDSEYIDYPCPTVAAITKALGAES